MAKVTLICGDVKAVRHMTMLSELSSAVSLLDHLEIDDLGDYLIFLNGTPRLSALINCQTLQDGTVIEFKHKDDILSGGQACEPESPERIRTKHVWFYTAGFISGLATAYGLWVVIFKVL